MMIIEFLVVLCFIALGAKLGSIGIGFAGGFGVLTLAFVFGLKPGEIPIDVILIIMSVIATVSSMQEAGGLDYLVHLSEKILRKQPKYITFLAPLVTYFLALFTGSGLTAFSVLPVIAEVAKKEGIRPSRPLSISAVSSQVAVTASPISAAVIFFSGELEKLGVDYVHLLLIVVPSTFIAIFVGAFISNFIGVDLKNDPIYQDRLAKGLVSLENKQIVKTLKPGAKRSVLIFAFVIVSVILYSIATSDTVHLIQTPILSRDNAIVTFMLSAATLIALFCQLNTKQILNTSTFKSGMSACICVLGVAWLGSTFVANHIHEINAYAGDLIKSKPWVLAVVLFFASMFLYSQAATTKALMPTALAIGVSPVAAIASFASVSALFVLPTYPTLLAAVEFDDTGSTRVGKYVFNHPFLVPGVVTIAVSVLLGFMFGHLIL